MLPKMAPFQTMNIRSGILQETFSKVMTYLPAI